MPQDDQPTQRFKDKSLVNQTEWIRRGVPLKNWYAVPMSPEDALKNIELIETLVSIMEEQVLSA